MSSVKLGNCVAEFERALRLFLSDFKVTLTQPGDCGQSEVREVVYRVEGVSLPTEVRISQSLDPGDKNYPQWRVRVETALDPSLAELLRPLEAIVNQFASLGALLTYDERVSVQSQSGFDADDLQFVAALCAAASVHSAPAIMASVNVAMRQSVVTPETSAWTDADFQDLHYDHSHFGNSRLGERQWSMLVHGRFTISFEAIDNNPYWHGGLLVLLKVPRQSVPQPDEAISVNNINKIDNFVGLIPMFGGWCERDGNLYFASFMPNFMKNLPGLQENLIRWSLARASAIDELVTISRPNWKGTTSHSS